MAKQHSLDSVFREIDDLREKLQGLSALSEADSFRRTKALATLDGCRTILKAACLSPAGGDYYEFDFTQQGGSAI